MANKKSVKDFTANTGKTVLDVIDAATAEPAPEQIARRSRKDDYTAEEIQIAREQGMTQGRKGVKALRINFALDPENYDYIVTCSQACGMSMTKFINVIVEKSRERNLDLYEDAKEMQARLI